MTIAIAKPTKTRIAFADYLAYFDGSKTTGRHGETIDNIYRKISTEIERAAQLGFRVLDRIQ